MVARWWSLATNRWVSLLGSTSAASIRHGSRIDADASGSISKDEFVAPLSRWIIESKTAPRFVKYNVDRILHQQDEQLKTFQLQLGMEIWFLGGSLEIKGGWLWVHLATDLVMLAGYLFYTPGAVMFGGLILDQRHEPQFDLLADRLDQLCEAMVPKVVGQVLDPIDPILETRVEQPQESAPDPPLLNVRGAAHAAEARGPDDTSDAKAFRTSTFEAAKSEMRRI
eukprot:Skav227766  [mRNA]  locus=scaffold1653:355596:358260:- [translate_table: standard]